MSRFACLCLFWLLTGVVTRHCLAAPVTTPKGYSLTPPTGWQTDVSGKTGNDVVVFIDDPAIRFTPNLGVRIGRAGLHDTLTTAKAYLNRTYPAGFPGWKLVAQRTSTVGGLAALDTTATCVSGPAKRLLRLRQALVIRAGRLFFFTCAAPEEAHAEYDPVFSGILRSVRWASHP